MYRPGRLVQSRSPRVSQSITLSSEPNHSTEGGLSPSLSPLGYSLLCRHKQPSLSRRPGLADSPARLAQPRRELPGRRVEPLPVQSDAGCGAGGEVTPGTSSAASASSSSVPAVCNVKRPAWTLRARVVLTAHSGAPRSHSRLLSRTQADSALLPLSGPPDAPAARRDREWSGPEPAAAGEGRGLGLATPKRAGSEHLLPFRRSLDHHPSEP